MSLIGSRTGQHIYNSFTVVIVFMKLFVFVFTLGGLFAKPMVIKILRIKTHFV